MKINTVRYVLLVASILLLCTNFYNGYIENEMNYLNIASNVLLAFAMVLTIRQAKKEKSQN